MVLWPVQYPSNPLTGQCAPPRLPRSVEYLVPMKRRVALLLLVLALVGVWIWWQASTAPSRGGAAGTVTPGRRGDPLPVDPVLGGSADSRREQPAPPATPEPPPAAVPATRWSAAVSVVDLEQRANVPGASVSVWLDMEGRRVRNEQPPIRLRERDLEAFLLEGHEDLRVHLRDHRPALGDLLRPDTWGEIERGVPEVVEANHRLGVTEHAAPSPRLRSSASSLPAILRRTPAPPRRLSPSL